MRAQSLCRLNPLQLSVGCPPGVWVCSTDMLLTVPSSPKINWDGFDGACVIAVPATQEYARNHGVYKIDKEVSDRGFLPLLHAQFDCEHTFYMQYKAK